MNATQLLHNPRINALAHVAAAARELANRLDNSYAEGDTLAEMRAAFRAEEAALKELAKACGGEYWLAEACLAWCGSIDPQPEPAPAQAVAARPIEWREYVTSSDGVHQYLVTRYAATAKLAAGFTCECEGFRWGGKCRHLGVAVLKHKNLDYTIVRKVAA